MKKIFIILALLVILMLACNPSTELVYLDENRLADYWHTQVSPSTPPDDDIIIDKDGDLDENGIQDIGNGINIDHDINNDNTLDWGNGENIPNLPIVSF